VIERIGSRGAAGRYMVERVGFARVLYDYVLPGRGLFEMMLAARSGAGGVM
jgi:hypothetical protein